jgi:4-oxalocrotonate tautomerase
VPTIRMDLLPGKSEEQKRKVIAEMTDAVERVLEVDRNKIQVILTEVPAAHWAVAGITLKEREEKNIG